MTNADEKYIAALCRKHGLTRGKLWQAFGEPSEKQADYSDAYADAVLALREAIETTKEKAAQRTSMMAALIRSLTLNEEDVRK